MDRFLSNAVNKIDKKGRVSIPAAFRAVLAAKSAGADELYTLMSLDKPAVDAGSIDLLNLFEERMTDFDPLTAQYDDLSFYYHGDSAFLKIDADGRITLTDAFRDHTGITDQVAFVGRGSFFQLWEPNQFSTYREAARKRLMQMRQDLVLPNSQRQENS